MNKREFLQLIANGEMNEEIQGFAMEQMEKMDAANERRKEKEAEKRAEKKAEQQPEIDALMGALTDYFQTAQQLIDAADIDIKPQAVRYRLAAGLEAGVVVKGEVKDGSRKKVGYKLA